MRPLPALLCAGLLLAGCQEPAADVAPAAMVPTVAPAPRVTATPDPYAVPEEIDAAYLNRVFEALDAVNGDMFRIVVVAGDITEDAYQLMTAIYTDEAWHDQVEILDDFLMNARDQVRPTPGNRRTHVVRILGSNPNCVLAEVARDFSEVAVKAAPDEEHAYIALRPKFSGDDPAAINATPWQIAWDRLGDEGNPCDAHS